MPAPWSAWLDKPQQVRAQASFRVSAPADHVVDLLRRPDAMLLVPDTVDLVPVPSTSLVVQILRRSGVTALSVLEARPLAEPGHVVSWWSPRTSTMTDLDVAPAGSGARVTVRLEHRAESRAKARGWRDFFDLALPAWRERLTAVATGFQPFPTRQPRLLVETQPALPENTGHLVSSRVLDASPEQVWDALVTHGPDRDGSFSFTEGSSRPTPGDVWFSLRLEEPVGHVRAHQVVAVEPQRLLVLRRLGHPFHSAVTSWRLESSAGGTLLSYDHECAASHAGMYDFAAEGLDAVERRLPPR